MQILGAKVTKDSRQMSHTWGTGNYSDVENLRALAVGTLLWPAQESGQEHNGHKGQYPGKVTQPRGEKAFIG